MHQGFLISKSEICQSRNFRFKLCQCFTLDKNSQKLPYFNRNVVCVYFTMAHLFAIWGDYLTPHSKSVSHFLKSKNFEKLKLCHSTVQQVTFIGFELEI